MIFFDVDTQRDFMDSTGALRARRRGDTSERRAAAARGRRPQVTTVSSRCAHEPGDPEFEIFPPHCIDGSPGAERRLRRPACAAAPEIEVDATADQQAQIHHALRRRRSSTFSRTLAGRVASEGSFQRRIVRRLRCRHRLLRAGLRARSGRSGGPCSARRRRDPRRRRRDDCAHNRRNASRGS